MIVRLFVVLFLAFASGASAEPVRVSAAEHGAMTRLSLEFNDRPVWELQRRGIGYRLTFSQVAPLTFDLSRLFRSIDRQRVRDVRAIGNNSLEIDLGCACDLRLSDAGEVGLVIEILSPGETGPEVQAEMAPIPLPDAGDASPETPGPDAMNSGFRNPLGLPAFAIERLIPLNATDQPVLPTLPTTGEEALNQSLAIDMVARALSRAAAQGLVTAKSEIAERPNKTKTGQSQQLGMRSNLMITTGFDRAMPSDAKMIPPTQNGMVCLPDASVDVSGWGDASQPADLGRLRRQAVAEDGSVDPDGAKALARYYIHMGFGAEARMAARFLPRSQDREIIEAIADIMDRGRTDSPVFEGQITCSSVVALWASLAGFLSQTNIPEDTNPILSAFSALPPHLRTHLGPLLSERLHDAGLQSEARTAINAVTRGGTRTDESELASARIELDGTQGERARVTLSELSNGTSVTAAAALLELLKDAEARGMAPNPAWVEDAPTLVGALEGTEIAEELNVAGLKGLIALGGFDDFRAAIAEDSPGVTSESRQELAIRALQAALENGSDLDFVTSEVGLSKVIPPERIERPTRVAIADRLAALGLASRAVRYVYGEPEGLDDLLVSVRVMLMEGRNKEAIELVRTSDFDGIESLLAQTLVTAGEEAQAIDAFAGAGQPDRALATALRTGDWGWITANGEDDVADAVRTLIEPIPEVSEASDLQNTALIEASRDRRSKVRALLERSAPSTSGDNFTN